MDINPFSIYFDHRPFRIAFLVNPKDGLEWIDAIFKYNNGKWGGRFNVIILTDGKTIDDKSWKFLKDFDPDIIKSTVPLEENLHKKIYIFTSPLSIEIPKNEVGGGKYVNVANDPIDILPTKENVSAIARDFFDNKSSLVIFEVDESTPDIIKKFLNRNFGLIKSQDSSYLVNERTLRECNIKKYKVVDFVTLNIALSDLGGFHNNVVYPVQVCSLPNKFKNPKWQHNNERFTVVVGDSVQDLVYFWNTPHFIQSWLRTSFTQLWTPREIIENTEVHEGLLKFIGRYTSRTGNDRHGVQFVSCSILDEDLKKIVSNFSAIPHPRTANYFVELPFPDYEESLPFASIDKGVDFFRARSNEEHLVFNEPNVRQGGMGGQHWFVDLYIQFRPERFTSIMGVNYWWQLPHRNSILHDLKFFNKPARINVEGSFSVLLSRSNEYNQEGNLLQIKLPEDKDIFASLTCGESFDCHENKEKAKFTSRPFQHIKRSDQGKYLSGVLSLFPDLTNAHSIFEDHFLRNIFQKMSNQNDSKDIKKIDEIKKTLDKAVKRGRDFSNSNEDLEWLANKVLTYSKNYAMREVDLSFEKFVEEAKKETDEYNKNPSGSPIPYDEDGLKDTISSLLQYTVLSVGIKPKCPLCGYGIWYSLDEAKQNIICKGCGYNFNMSAEETWYYRLNSLVKSAVSFHGTIPVLLVLGQLLHDARSSFLYLPSAELQSRNGDRFISEAEIDLLCIKDGEFIIGEIKRSVSLFGKNDFEKIAKVAKVIKPDQIIFSSLDESPSVFVQDNIDRLRTELSYLEIKVDWYKIDYWVFRASPVR